jgi:predicted small secreted protein
MKRLVLLLVVSAALLTSLETVAGATPGRPIEPTAVKRLP